MAGKSRQQMADEVMENLRNQGHHDGRDHTMVIDQDEAVASVIDRRTGRLVAYSATRADFADSIAEFVYDFMV